MRLISKTIEKDGSGSITLYPEELEDMWHIYNLISVGDHLKANTLRRVQSQSTTGSTTSHRVRLTLTIKVETIDFDTQAGVLRINGRVVSENQYVKLNAYHTIDLELNRNLTLSKLHWDTIALERVTDACDIAKQADVAAVVLQEGLANVCLVTPNMTVVRQRVEIPIPRKRRGSVANHEKGLEKFFEKVLEALLRHVNFDIVKAVIIGSPGFVREQFYQYIFDQAVRTENLTLLTARPKFLLVHTTSGHKQSLSEVLTDNAISSKLADTKAARETFALEKFYTMLGDNPDRAFYGFDHVRKAGEKGAIATLLVTDELFRSADIATRRKYVELVEQTRAQGGEVYVFSSLHVSGEQLNQLTGVAAILNFPLPDIELEETESPETVIPPEENIDENKAN